MQEIRIRGLRRLGAVSLMVGLAGAALALSFDLFHKLIFAIICGVAILAGVIGLFDRRVQLALSDEGIRYRRWGPAVVPWQEFAGFRWVSWRRSPHLQIVERRPSELVATLSPLGKLNHFCCGFLGMRTFSIAVHPLDIAESELEAWVSRYLPKHPG